MVDCTKDRLGGLSRTRVGADFGNGWIKMVDLPDDALHTGPVSFMSAPYTHDLSGAKTAVLGVPFDCGVHPFRIGSRQGPAAIRGQSILVRSPQSPMCWLSPMRSSRQR